ncbi:LAQU0S07e01068g1_1 [Lachancea quebecensis]|uniref:LAQU0S07e01068g1_1 n=1 Tax=Lachancea quebecensis TaxID=1654605 RepID=A0A0P1KRX3_9SACH|nr:LAQU0S07e01068g1_1 [Lachancea quebecensis]
MKEGDAEEPLVYAPGLNQEGMRLPRDIFSNKLQYLVTRHMTPLIAIGIELAVCAFLIYLAHKCAYRNNRAGITAIIVTIGSFVILITAISIEVAILNEGTIPTSKVQFMKEIAISRPGIDAKEWDYIALKMNSVFYNNSSWVTPYFFYNGNSCYSFFRAYYLKPYKKSTDAGNTNGDAGDEFQPFIHQAIKAYEERVNEYWQSALSGEASVGNQTIGV